MRRRLRIDTTLDAHVWMRRREAQGTSEEDEAHNARDVKRFDEIARQTQLLEELQTAIGTFLASFATVESAALNAAPSALSTDSTVIEFLPELMDLSNRLKRLKYVAIEKKLPEALQEDIAAMRRVANALRDCRNDIAHGTALLYGHVPYQPDLWRSRC